MGNFGESDQPRCTKHTKKTIHHCPGENGWVGEWSPSGCNTKYHGDLGGIYCKKHQMPCRQGCVNQSHMKNQPGCQSCKGKWAREAKAEREAKENVKVNEKDKQFEEFMNPGRTRKKEKK